METRDSHSLEYFFVKLHPPMHPRLAHATQASHLLGHQTLDTINGHVLCTVM